MKDTGKFAIGAAVSVLLSTTAAVAQSPDALEQGFENPPAATRPLVWWHWMNGNISQEGIKLDLEWMHRVGIAGFQNFDAALATPQVVDKRISYMTPEWKDDFKYAIQLGDQFGMEMGIAGSPGWSESGGPWVPPSHAMKKYVWSETIVEGNQPFTGKLSQPPGVTGPYQNIESISPLLKDKPHYYADAAVVAFPVPGSPQEPRITASGEGVDPKVLTDGDLVTDTILPGPPSGTKSWIQFEYPRSQTIRAITLVTHEPRPSSGRAGRTAVPVQMLEASDDGQTFRDVLEIKSGRGSDNTVAVPPVTAKFFRVTFRERQPAASLSGKAAAAPGGYAVSELVLHPDARVTRLKAKAAFVNDPNLYGSATPAADADAVVKSSAVIDLTAKMRPDGSLDWTPPAGRWVVLRIGYSLLGVTNHPATPEATGLEVDKLDHAFVRDYFEKYLDSYKDVVGGGEMGKRGIQNVVNDSWEAGSQNWTDNMLGQFKKARGYDPGPWLPVLAGRVVDSAQASDRFLWDFRKTIADLIATEHYGQLEETLHQRGMRHYGESHESGRALVADGMEVKKFNEVPMSAMWMGHRVAGYNADDRESASVAHIYGQNVAAAESLTASNNHWGWSPATLKPTADQELLNGINRFVIHESTHQPLVGKAPGLTLGKYGQWFNRNETWAEQAGPWIDYLARSSYLLTQGRFAADFVYFYGEDSNLTAIFANQGPNVPAGYAYDYINADALIHELSVTDGHLVTRSGMEYRVLGLDPFSQHMSLPVLRAIHKLVEDGAVVAGPKPTDDPSLADDQAEFAKLSGDLFGDSGDAGVHTLGKGTVYAGQTVSQALEALGTKRDFDYTKQNEKSDIQFVHRKLPNGDIYFVNNRGGQDEDFNASFRVEGKVPELWYAETGQSRPVSFKIENGATTVPLHLETDGTVFVVFQKAASQTSLSIPKAAETKLATLAGPWKIEFEPGRGAPASITMAELSDWSTSADPGVMYFSGAGTYTNTVIAPAEWFTKGVHLWIDLGDVKNLAVLTVNGKNVGETWHAPYRLDVTAFLKPGPNEIRIKVVNAWVNRLIGDEQPGATKYTYADYKAYNADSKLQPSGLLGPVSILRLDDGQGPTPR